MAENETNTLSVEQHQTLSKALDGMLRSQQKDLVDACNYTLWEGNERRHYNSTEQAVEAFVAGIQAILREIERIKVMQDNVKKSRIVMKADA